MIRHEGPLGLKPGSTFLIAIAASVVAICAIVGLTLLVASAALVMNMPGGVEIGLAIAVPAAGLFLAWIIARALITSVDLEGPTDRKSGRS